MSRAKPSADHSVDPSQVSPPSPTADPADASSGAEGPLGIVLGLVVAAAFYLFAWAVPLAAIERYFLGHPVAIAATILFAIAASILAVKAVHVRGRAKLTAGLRDDDLLPAFPGGDGATEQWLLQNDAGRVAKLWLASLAQLPTAARTSPLAVRLAELLRRQSTRVSTRHQADDLREISSREADVAHDSLQLVRIIVWAIPMLGFLGTVIGITQTLGGLDFSDGTAAVDRLKSGLYVAFDTTALGLVLSVVAIFLQFPVERSEQRLLAEIDRRVGAILAARLPSDDHADNPAAQISQLCDGIRVAVADSLASQAQLWRTTIDEAHSHWHRIAEDNGARIGEALTSHLTPLLSQHSQSLGDHAHSLRKHSDSIASVRDGFVSDLDQRWNEWNQRLVQASGQAGDLGEMQRMLDSNLMRLVEANAAVQHSLQVRDEAQLETRVADQLSDAMLALARAVDLLGQQLPPARREALAAATAATNSASAGPASARQTPVDRSGSAVAPDVIHDRDAESQAAPRRRAA